MYVLITFGTLLLLIDNAQCGEECFAVCDQTQTTQKFQSQIACKEGCRLQEIFAFASNHVISTREECYNGCAKSYNDEAEKQACSFGCDKQPDMKKYGRPSLQIRVSITNKSPTFQVVRGAMEKMMHRISSSFSSLGELGSSSSEKHGERSWEDPFTQFDFYMQNEIARLHQIAQNIRNLQGARSVMPVIAKKRPEGHEKNAMEGFRVGNNDKNGEKIVDIKPVGLKNKEQLLLEYEGENPTVMEASSLLSRLASRARHLWALSQWLVCVALFLCFVSVLSISVAILKQIKSQKYLNLRNMRSVIPPALAEPLAAKKVLESTVVVTDYPLILNTPPPAYDQLSVHKEKPENSADNSDPNV